MSEIRCCALVCFNVGFYDWKQFSSCSDFLSVLSWLCETIPAKYKYYLHYWIGIMGDRKRWNSETWAHQKETIPLNILTAFRHMANIVLHGLYFVHSVLASYRIRCSGPIANREGRFKHLQSQLLVYKYFKSTMTWTSSLPIHYEKAKSATSAVHYLRLVNGKYRFLIPGLRSTKQTLNDHDRIISICWQN